MKRVILLVLLIMPLAVPAAESARAKGMTIFGDQEMPHVRTDLPWRTIDIDELEHASLDGMIRGVLDESSRLARQHNRELVPTQSGRADFRGLIQAYRMKTDKSESK